VGKSGEVVVHPVDVRAGARVHRGGTGTVDHAGRPGRDGSPDETWGLATLGAAMDTQHPPARRGLGIGSVLFALLLLALLVGSYLLGRVDVLALFDDNGEFQRVGPTTVQSIRSLAELTTVEMVEYTTVEKGDDRGWLDWARGDRIYMLAVARIGAGVDLSQLGEEDFEVDTETGSVRVSLPGAQITYVALDNEATHVFDRDTGLFTRGDPQLESAARLAAEEILLQGALEQGILERASSTAEQVITQFLESLGYTDVTVVTR
ncbi:MAG: DUF4230 domain-containing protein, partial [Acidimicrobiia bacterium]